MRLSVGKSDGLSDVKVLVTPWWHCQKGTKYENNLNFKLLKALPKWSKTSPFLLDPMDPIDRPQSWPSPKQLVPILVHYSGYAPDCSKLVQEVALVNLVMCSTLPFISNPISIRVFSVWFWLYFWIWSSYLNMLTQSMQFLYFKLVWTYSAYELIEFGHNYPEYLIKWHEI